MYTPAIGESKMYVKDDPYLVYRFMNVSEYKSSISIMFIPGTYEEMMAENG
jgi:hypothetical protein